MGRSAVPISWARGRTLRGLQDPVKPERPFSRWPRPHCPERPAEVSSCVSVAASEAALVLPGVLRECCAGHPRCRRPSDRWRPRLPVRSYRCASLLIPGVVPLRRSSWNEPAPFRLGARPGSRCRCAPPRCLTAHRPVTPHRILRLPTASLPCSPDALDPRPLSRPSGRHDEGVPLRPCHAATGRGARTARPSLCSSARAISSSVASVPVRGTSSPKAGVIVGLRARTGCGP